MKKLLPFYSLFIGIAVILMWGVILSHGSLPEGIISMVYHLTSEFIMAVFCIAGFIFRKRTAGLILTMAGLTMVLYSVLNAAGYYKDFASMFIFFNILAVVTIPFLIVNIRLLMDEVRTFQTWS